MLEIEALFPEWVEKKSVELKWKKLAFYLKLDPDPMQ